MDSSPLVNQHNAHYSSPGFTSNTVPTGPHTMPTPTPTPTPALMPSSEGSHTGGRRKKRRKRRTITKRKPRRRTNTKKRKMRRTVKRRRVSRGGAFQTPMTVPNYANGHNQYGNNQGGISSAYSLANARLSAGESALANPPPYQWLKQGGVDNLNHNTENAHGNIGAGSGFPSRGWF